VKVTTCYELHSIKKEEQTQWMVYYTIRKIEATFRVLKTDLDLRPQNRCSGNGAPAPGNIGLLGG